MKTKILITGGKGYVAREIVRHLDSSYDITTINRDIFDLRDRLETHRWFKNKYYNVIIHTAIKGGSRLEKDSSNVLDDNITMYLNLLSCNQHYNKFVNIGSGAEIFDPESYYGLSKKIINTSILDKNNFYNLRIFSIFNENELNTRFIKNNINRYINKESIIIHQNKYMDFIYFQDFISIIKKYIDHDNLPKTMDCVYETKYSLLDISNIINKLHDYKLNINILNNNNGNNYTGQYCNLGLKYIGLEDGVKDTYRKIYYEKNMVRS